MDKPNEIKVVFFAPQLEVLFFDMQYDRFIKMTDTEALIENISTESLEVFLYQTAKFFYGCRLSSHTCN